MTLQPFPCSVAPSSGPVTFASVERRVRYAGLTEAQYAAPSMSHTRHCSDAGLRHRTRRALAATCAWLLAFLLVANGAAGQAGRLAAEKQARIESAISLFMTDSQTPGVSAAVMQDRELVWSAGFGMADLAAGRK